MDEPAKPLRSHKDLNVWQWAMDLAVEGYALADRFPPKETYRLTSQLTRALASVPLNIAEGNARGTRRDYANFVSIARGSLMEVETLLMLAARLGYFTDTDLAPTMERITTLNKMLISLHKRLREA